VSKKPVSRPALGDLYHNYDWQAQENAPLRKAPGPDPGFEADLYSCPAQKQLSVPIGAMLGARP
jgi:hypothetical protein